MHGLKMAHTTSSPTFDGPPNLPTIKQRLIKMLRRSIVYRRTIKEESKVVNLNWINNQACRLSQNIYVISNLFKTNNYLFEVLRKTHF